MNGREQPELFENESLIVIARAVRTRGLKGEIVADLLTDFPDRFERISRLLAVSPAGERKAVQLEAHWFQQRRVILKLKECDNIESASALVGYEFAVPESERVKLAEGQLYDWELEGCAVATVIGRHIGAVKRVVRTGGVDLLEVEDEERRYRLIPMVESILVEIDMEKKSILIDPPQGLLDL